MILAYKPDKLDPRATGPCRIEQVHVNGTAQFDEMLTLQSALIFVEFALIGAEVFILFRKVQGFLRLFDC